VILLDQSKESPKNGETIKNDDKIMSRRLNLNSRRVSKEGVTNKMFLKQFHGNNASTFSKERKS
jgi:hypothetical protein